MCVEYIIIIIIISNLSNDRSKASSKTRLQNDSKIYMIIKKKILCAFQKSSK